MHAVWNEELTCGQRTAQINANISICRGPVNRSCDCAPNRSDHVDISHLTCTSDKSNTDGDRGLQWRGFMGAVGRIRVLASFCPAIRNEVRTTFRPTPFYLLPRPCHFKRDFQPVY